MNDQDREAFEKWWFDGFKGMSDKEIIKYKDVGKQTSLHGWINACKYKQKEINKLIDCAGKDNERDLKLQAENAKLKREVEVLRLYCNKDCTAMADEVLENE